MELIAQDGGRVGLDPKEFEVLDFLIFHYNDFFNARAIVEKVWSPSTFVGPNSASQALSGIRQKLETLGLQLDRILESSKRKGVRFILPPAASESTNLIDMQVVPPVVQPFYDGGLLECPHFVGRHAELQLLDEVYAHKEFGIVCISAGVGGEGKSQLARKWLDLAYNRANGNICIFCFSFNGQGTIDNRQSPIGEFFRAAYTRFGVHSAADTPLWEMPKKLAYAIRSQRSILYLDGLEALQYAPADGRSAIRDQAMSELLRLLAVPGSHFCVITTRYPIIGIEESLPAVKSLPLKDLDADASVELLRCYGVSGENSQLAETAKSWDYHALSVNLLGSYLKAYSRGDLRGCDTIQSLHKSEAASSVPYKPQSMLDAHERALAGKAELQMLRILGLFDRPVDEGIVWHLAAQQINNISDQLTPLNLYERDALLVRLQDLSLITVIEKDRSPKRYIDCHALIREHQRDRLQNSFAKAWTEANTRLFCHFRDCPSSKTPDSNEEIDMLYRAIAHGCEAGLHSQAFDEVYWPRISREDQHFCTDSKGFVTEDLAALGSFFDPPWIKTGTQLDSTPKLRAKIRSLAGFRLRTLGRLRNAEAVIEQALQDFKDQEAWEEASGEANNLAVLHRMQGNLPEAIRIGKLALQYAGWIETEKRVQVQIHRKAALAEFYHYFGKLRKALDLLQQAEQAQAESDPAHPRLTSTLGFRYCELLITLGQIDKVKERAVVIPLHETSKYALLDKGLAALCLGRALIYEAERGSRDSLLLAEAHLRESCELMKRSQHGDNQIRANVALAECLRLRGNIGEASMLVDKATTIATLNGMHFHKLDCDFENIQIQSALSLEGVRGKLKKLAENASAMHYGLLVTKIQRVVNADAGE